MCPHQCPVQWKQDAKGVVPLRVHVVLRESQQVAQLSLTFTYYYKGTVLTGAAKHSLNKIDNSNRLVGLEILPPPNGPIVHPGTAILIRAVQTCGPEA